MNLENLTHEQAFNKSNEAISSYSHNKITYHMLKEEIIKYHNKIEKNLDKEAYALRMMMKYHENTDVLRILEILKVPFKKRQND